MSDEVDWMESLNTETRYRKLYEAIRECMCCGVSRDSIRTIMYETNCRFEPDPEHREIQ